MSAGLGREEMGGKDKGGKEERQERADKGEEESEERTGTPRGKGSLGRGLERVSLGLALACVAIVCLYSLATLVWHLRADQGLAEAMSINTVGGSLTGVVLGATFSGTAVVWLAIRIVAGSGDGGRRAARCLEGDGLAERPGEEDPGEEKCGLEGRGCKGWRDNWGMRVAETGNDGWNMGAAEAWCDRWAMRAGKAGRAARGVCKRLGPVGALVILSLVGQIALIVALQTRFSSWWDSMLLASFANTALVEGIPGMLASPADDLFGTAGNYLSCYPFQTGYLFLIMACIRAFGSGFAMALQVINAIANEVGALAVVWIGRELGLDGRGMRALCFTLGFSLPFWLLCTFAYGNAIGYAFAFLALAMNVRAMGRHDVARRVMWVGLSLAPMAVALTFKATTMLIMVAIALAWLVRCLGDWRSLAGLACFVLCLLVTRSVSAAPFDTLVRMSDGYEFKGAETTLAHIELGLRMGQAETMSSVNDSDLAATPGQYSMASARTWVETGGDAKAQDEAAWSRIREDVAAFMGNPLYGARFFFLKLASMWGDPSYQSLYVLGKSVGADGVTTVPVAAALTSPVGQSTLTSLMRGVQVMTFVGALVALADMTANGADRGSHAAVSVALAFVVGFGFYVLWEAKALYVLPFAVVILPLSAQGVVRLLDDVGVMGARKGQVRPGGKSV